MRKPNPLAIVALVCGILVLPTCGILSIPAVVCGHLGLSKSKREAGGSGYIPALIGTILGYLGFVQSAGLFVGSLIYLLAGNLDAAKVSRVDADFQAISTQLRTYEMQNLHMPSTVQGLGALVVRPSGEPAPRRWIQLLESMPLDPWGEPYEYSNPGLVNQQGFDLLSKGPDRQLGTADDIGNK